MLFVTVGIVLQQLQAFFSQTRSTCTLMINVIFNISGQHSEIPNPASLAGTPWSQAAASPELIPRDTGHTVSLPLTLMNIYKHSPS